MFFFCYLCLGDSVQWLWLIVPWDSLGFFGILWDSLGFFGILSVGLYTVAIHQTWIIYFVKILWDFLGRNLFWIMDCGMDSWDVEEGILFSSGILFCQDSLGSSRIWDSSFSQGFHFVKILWDSQGSFFVKILWDPQGFFGIFRDFLAVCFWYWTEPWILELAGIPRILRDSFLLRFFEIFKDFSGIFKDLGFYFSQGFFFVKILWDSQRFFFVKILWDLQRIFWRFSRISDSFIFQGLPFC